MKRVYTDVRFPGCKIVNEGSTTFEVVEGGKRVSCFESWDLPDGTVTEGCAARRAEDYFNRRATSTPVLFESAQDGRRFNSMEIDRVLAQEGAETDLGRRQRLQQRAVYMLRREESLPEAVVQHLLES